MVEDEFLATAQLFTKHLHHAEYQRLKQEARNRSAETIRDILRPVDTKTAMREETRKQKQSEAASKNMLAELSDIGIKAVRDNKEESESNVDSENEPWQGTHLHQLIKNSPTSGARSLIGLHGIKSNTRAAAGYQPADSSTSEKPSLKARLANASMKRRMDILTDDEEDEDDLDAPSHPQHSLFRNVPPKSIIKNGVCPLPSSAPASDRRFVSKPHKPTKRAFLDLSLPSSPEPTTQKLKTPTVRAASPLPSLIKSEEVDLSDDAIKFDTVRKRLKEGREKWKKKEEAGTGGERATKQLDEIPLFLV